MISIQFDYKFECDVHICKQTTNENYLWLFESARCNIWFLINTSINYLQGNFNIGVRTERLILNTGVGTDGSTGIVTYFNVFGNLSKSFASEMCFISSKKFVISLYLNIIGI